MNLRKWLAMKGFFGGSNGGTGGGGNCVLVSDMTNILPNTANHTGNYDNVKLRFPNATVVSEGAFEGMDSTTYIDLPKVTSIGDGAFWWCTALDTIILRNTETVCEFIVTAIVNTKILTADGMPTGEGFIYVPTKFYETYVANLVAQVMMLGHDEATATYLVTAVLRKIEDYPEICG